MAYTLSFREALLVELLEMKEAKVLERDSKEDNGRDLMRASKRLNTDSKSNRIAKAKKE